MRRSAAFASVVGMSSLLMATAAGQRGSESVQTHVAAARAAAGQDLTGLFDRLCSDEALRPPPATPSPRTPARQDPPDRSEWHAEPVQVFDNLYFVGQTEYSAWAVKTSEGIVIIDTIFDYSVEDEVVNGLRTLGLDQAQIKY